MVELVHLAVGSPTEVGVPGFPQISIRDFVETACRVKARGNLVGNRLIMDEAVHVRGADRLFIEAHRVEVAAFNPGDLGAHQHGAVLEILRTILCPYLELSMMRG